MSQRPVVWMLVNRLADGGAERLIVELALRLPARGYDVTVCTTRTSPAAEGFARAQRERLHAAGVRVVGFDRRHRLDSLRMRQLVGRLRNARVDVLHTHMFGSNLWGSALGRIAGVPVIVAHEHGWSYERESRRWVNGHVIARLASAVAVGSSANRTRMIVLEGVAPEKAVFIPNAFFPRDQPGGDVRRELGLAPEAFVVGTVAKLRREKALEVLLAAFVPVLAQIPDARLVIAGDGALRGELEALAGRLGIAGTTSFLGPREDVEAIIRGLDVSVVCSDFEATSLFALEAMTYGSALACTDVGGLRDLLTDGVTGLLVAPRDPEALAGAILKLAGDPPLRARLVEAARARARLFSADVLVDRYDALYRSLLAQRA